MEEQSLRREQGGMRNHLGSIWQPTGKHLSGKHLFGGLEAEEASGRHLEVRSGRPILGIVEEKSTTRNDEGGVIVRGIIEKESLRRHSGGAIIEGGASGNPLGALWEASVWESFGSHLGVIWRA
jgi:hypothetical protein